MNPMELAAAIGSPVGMAVLVWFLLKGEIRAIGDKIQSIEHEQEICQAKREKIETDLYEKQGIATKALGYIEGRLNGSSHAVS